MPRRKTGRRVSHAAEDDLYSRIAARFASPTYATFRQVADATGRAGSRYADAISMGLWPSRGLELHGFELKSHRGDWLRELKNPRKAEAIARLCDRWWIVAPDASVVKASEVPINWGLLVVHGAGLKQLKAAEQLKAMPMTREFLAALLRRAAEAHERDLASSVPKRDVEPKLREAYERGKKDGGGPKVVEYDLKRIQEAVAKFEAASGVKIDKWNGERIGAAVNAVLKKQSAQHAITAMRGAVDRFLATAQALKKEMDDL